LWPNIHQNSPEILGVYRKFLLIYLLIYYY
jgi:hypothetical protein